MQSILKPDHMKKIYLLATLLLFSTHCFSKPEVEVLPAGKKNPTLMETPVAAWTETFDTPRPIVVHFLKVDLTDPEVEAFVQVSADPDGPEGPAEGVLTLPRDLMNDPSILAMINANAFAKVPSIKSPPEKEAGSSDAT